MKRIKQTSLFILGLALTVALLPTPIFAQTAIQETVTEERCTFAKEKITTRLATLAELKKERETKYVAIKGRIDTLVTSATAAGYPDVTKLISARNNVTKTINTYSTQAVTYKTALEKAESSPCGEGTGEFVIALNTARVELVSLRTNSTAIKNAIKKEAIPALQNYASWLKTNVSTTKENK